MKEYRKNGKKFICEECNNEFGSKTALSIHLMKIHNISPKEYFDKWIKEKGEGICKICGNETKFVRSDYGYNNTCCKKCQDIYCIQQMNVTIKETYGVDNVFQLDYIKEQSKKTNLEKYGDEKYRNHDQIKKTNLEKYGVEYPFESEIIRNKAKQSFTDKTGYEYNFQSPEVKQKIKEVCLAKYGTEYANQCELVKNKIKETNLNKYGTYCYLQNEKIKEQIKKRNLENFGVECVLSNQDIKQN